jgi:hypothetical protein
VALGDSSLQVKIEHHSNTYYKSPLRTSRPSESAQEQESEAFVLLFALQPCWRAQASATMASSPDYVTTARGYKVVYNAPESFFNEDHCASCAAGGDAVLMEEGECPRCGSYHHVKLYECCESCDREWAEARERSAVTDGSTEWAEAHTRTTVSDGDREPSYQDELRELSLEVLRAALEKVKEDLPALAEDYSEFGQEVLEDAMRWKAAYEAEFARREALQPGLAAGAAAPPEEERAAAQDRDLIPELQRARANYHSALMSDPARPGYDRACSNFEDEVDELERALQDELEVCVEESRRSRAVGVATTSLDEWIQSARDALKTG